MKQINAPTVAQFIEFLQTNTNPDDLLLIEDTDTRWTIHIIHLSTNGDGIAWLSGDYREMISSSEKEEELFKSKGKGKQ